FSPATPCDLHYFPTRRSSDLQAFRYSVVNGWLLALGDLAGGSFASAALGVNQGGSVVVGWGTSSAGKRASIWTGAGPMQDLAGIDRKSTRLNSSHDQISYAVF